MNNKLLKLRVALATLAIMSLMCFLTGCNKEEGTLGGMLFGAGTGAVIGGAVKGSAGAGVGAVIGAVGGAVIGNAIADERSKCTTHKSKKCNKCAQKQCATTQPANTVQVGNSSKCQTKRKKSCCRSTCACHLPRYCKKKRSAKTQATGAQIQALDDATATETETILPTVPQAEESQAAQTADFSEVEDASEEDASEFDNIKAEDPAAFAK